MSVKILLIIISVAGILWMFFEGICNGIDDVEMIKDTKFKKQCPDVRCTKCNYHYYDEKGESRCQLYEQLDMATKKPTTGDGKES